MGEKKEIRISVKDKIACLVDKEQFLVCGNNDYEVVFDFDSDWEGINSKTAVFVYGKNPIHQPFVGNVCQGVAVENATLCAIGVFAGNIKTTTGATIECKPSIRDLGGVPKPPSKEVYDEIMALLDKAIEAHTELPTGGKKGQVLKKVSDKDYDTAWENDEQRDLTEIEESLANKLDKITTPSTIYGVDKNGNQMFHYISSLVLQNVTVKRDENKDILVLDEPVSENGATSKKFVDKKKLEAIAHADSRINTLEERVSDLESLTLTFTEDKTVAYNKSVPANVGKYALIKSIGGASKASDNICDPRSLTSNEEITVNADNSITFDVAANGMTSINLPTLPKGTYYCVVETNTNITVNPYTSEGVVTNNPFEITSDTDNLYFEFENKDWSGSETQPVTVTAKIAVFKGSTKRGYEPFFSGFKNAEVSKIESRGANLIPFPYKYGGITMDVGYTKTQNGLTFEVLEDGWISVRGTATEQTWFYFFSANLPKGNYYMGGVQPDGGTKGIIISTYINESGGQNGSGYTNKAIPHNGGLYQMYLLIYKGYTLNTIFKPILTKDVYVADFKPYKAEPIDTFVIPEDVKLKAVNDTYYDYIEFKDDKVFGHKVTEEIVLNGTEHYFLNTYLNNNYQRLGYQTALEIKGLDEAPLCTHFDGKKWGSNLSAGTNIVWNVSGTHLVFITDGAQSIDEFKAYLAEQYANGNPVTVVYALATPIVTDITDLFTEDNSIQVQGGGTLVPVNENELPVPTTIAYVTRKG